jgi:hypothetical protein
LAPRSPPDSSAARSYLKLHVSVTKLVWICCKKSELHDDSLRQFKNRLRPDKEIVQNHSLCLNQRSMIMLKAKLTIQLDKSFKAVL